MKKIGLVPLEYHSFNYGGTLQNYALQQAITKSGYIVEVFNFDNENEKLFSPSSPAKKMTIASMFKKRVQKAFNLLFFKEVNGKKVKFKEFREKYFVDMREPVLTNLCKVTKEFDCFVCGSDQVWNPYWAKSDHFLSFVPNDIPKVSYAASIGVDELSDHQKKVYKPLINNFSLISVREKKGKEILESFIDDSKNVEVVLDPTMLLTSKEWDLILPENKIKEKYIFTYFLGEDSKLRESAEAFAKEYGYKIVNIPYLYGDFRKSDFLFGHIKYSFAGPEDFVNLIKNAEIVLTDSFHACVFSIIYKKDFYVFDRKVYGKSMSSRITGLLDSLDISDRILSTNHNMKEVSIGNINYENVNIKLHDLRISSLSFLKQAINVDLKLQEKIND
ncbi:polysaccharide pyruvyl transferase family protein [Exiguobacterium sp. s151]|uniref:polysaccharide pyruvyl transferase family protein n=1 Tax=Exiguobacterium sp. s151 TaxID=2751229 RepID=UPI001BEA5288|nr:polysaccharide pyruvyl transferase family protein [Exiguobacterium sp. s151]